jgi:murein DD-endopeptidase MepM/ murein hydrolase activator NlpD
MQTPVGSWNWPLVPRPEVIRGFAIGPALWSPGHRGVDLAARPGAVVRAPAAGIVRYTGVIAGRAVLTLDHGGGLLSSFEPVISALRKGRAVKQGDVVGSVATGPTHCAPATCLHWGVRKNGNYINPLTLLRGWHGPIVLLPMLSG